MESKETLKQEFTSAETYDYEDFLDEAIETIAGSESFLDSRKDIDSRPSQMVEKLREMKRMQVVFAKELSLQKLTKKDFAGRKMKPSPDVEKYLRSHNFYILRIPVTLMPVAGWAFTRLECWLGMECDGSDPKIHDIYPDEIWTEVLKLQTGLSVGLDESLKFHAGLQLPDLVYQSLSGGAKTRVSLNAQGTAAWVVGPFQYKVSRPQVYSRGVENSQAFWRLDGREYVDREEPALSLVIRVPKQAKELFTSSELIAYQQFDFLGADMKDWAGDFSDKLKSFFSAGLPKRIQGNWHTHLT